MTCADIFRASEGLPMVVPFSISPRNLAILLVSPNTALPTKTKLNSDPKRSTLYPHNPFEGNSLMGYRMSLTKSQKHARNMRHKDKEGRWLRLRTSSLVRSHACIRKTGTYLHPRRTKLPHAGRGSRPSSQSRPPLEGQTGKAGACHAIFSRGQPKHAQPVK